MNKRGQAVCFIGHWQIGEATAAVDAKVTEVAGKFTARGIVLKQWILRH